ncbi:MAG: 3-oxoacyl-[acyl-carrier-protein] reductase [Tepidanaerobacteraceae bacterium]|jgi:3-oxoacyl-[acyl-carrier protein] reductase
MNLSNKICLVTGGSRGIGRSISLELAKAGAIVIINFLHNEKAASELVSKIEGFGETAIMYKSDVSSYDQVSKMVDDVISKYGRIDVLINNAGIAKDTLLLRMTEKNWDEVIDTNLKGVFNCTKACIKYMVKQRSGRIINISSIVGIYGNVGQANYAAAKAGIIGFTKSLAKELGKRGITVNAVAPGFVKTDMTVDLLKMNLEIENKIPLNRIGNPEDVANTVVFLASKRAEYITGQVISIDGGLTL